MDQIRNWSIYKITSPSGRVYIGVTSNIKGRMRAYRNSKSTQRRIVNQSICKYGYDNHAVEIIDTFKSHTSFAMGKEKFWIRTYMSNVCKYPDARGMNITDGGEGSPGYKPTAESINKRLSSMGKFNHSEDTKKRISAAHKGKPSPSKGCKRSEQFKKNLSDKAKGHKRNLGRKRPESDFCNQMKPVIEMNDLGDITKEFPSIKAAAAHFCITQQGFSYYLDSGIKRGGFIYKRKKI